MNVQIKSFLKSVILYLILMRLNLSIIFGAMIAFLITMVFSFFEEIICNRIEISYNFSLEEDFFFIIWILSMPIFAYIFAKCAGLFKKLKMLNLNYKKEILLILLISSLSYMFSMINFPFLVGYFSGNENRENWHVILLACFSLIPAFFLYKYFQYLTKKYPIPFEKIGYYTSIEFYKDLFRKLFN